MEEGREMSCASAAGVDRGEGTLSAGERWLLVGKRTGLASEVATMKSERPTRSQRGGWMLNECEEAVDREKSVPGMRILSIRVS